jgi:hypothetical protein
MALVLHWSRGTPVPGPSAASLAMDYSDLLRRLWRLKLPILGALLIGMLIGALTLFRISLLPPSLESRGTSYGVSATQLIVDSPQSAIGDIDGNFSSLSRTAALYAAVFSTPSVEQVIKEEAGLAPDADLVIGEPTIRTASNQQTERTDRLLRESAEGGDLAIYFSTQEELPLIDVQTVAPTRVQADRLAVAAVEGVRRFVADQQSRAKVSAAERVELRSLGRPESEQLTGGPELRSAVITGVVIAGVLVLVLLVIDIGVVNPAMPVVTQRGDRALS